MKRNTMLFVLTAALCAVGAYAQAPNSDPAQAAPQTKEQKKAAHKAAWENGVKTDCAAEIADGGVCAGKDFDSGLEKCLHKNRKKLSDGCRTAIHPHRKDSKDKKGGAKTGDTQQTPPATP